jgi:hypothetical protein
MDVGFGQDGAEKRWRWLVMPRAVGRVMAWFALCMALCQPVASQTVNGEGEEMRILGSVQIDQNVAGFVITYVDDAAFLMLSVAGDDGKAAYIPLFASTYRGIPSVTLDVFASQAAGAIWVQSSWPGSEVLAYYKFGAATALTPFGEMALLDTATPQRLSGGPVPFPALDPQTVSKRASFYVQETP